MRPKQVVNTSKQLAIELALLAKEIRKRVRDAISIESDKGPLRQIMETFHKSLIHDLSSDDFSDMYAQTIAYGLLSASITSNACDKDGSLASSIPITNPFLKELMDSFIGIGQRKWDKKKGRMAGIDFDELGVNEIIDLIQSDSTNMEAVLRDFGAKNPLEDPVIHFYELFLKEYDAEMRMQRGVFYTPRPVVSFIVRSVDELLRTEFDLDDGLADTTTWGEMVVHCNDLEIPEGATLDQAFVQILDPATGTGTFLVEVIDLIYTTLTEKWQAEGNSKKKVEQLWNDYVPKHLLPRLHGYELMMAPYAIAHMKIGLKLYETGYRFKSDERARIYLTNSLEPAQDFSGTFEFAIPALAHEAEAVNTIKKDKRFTVVIGNPPYAGHSTNISPWIEALVDDYFQISGTPLNEANSKWLRDDYVKFVRFGQEMMRSSRVGLFSFITNHGYIDNPTFRGMRFSLLADFRRMWVTDLHGNMKKKERDDAGKTDENIFDIQQGVAVFTAIFGHVSTPEVWHGDVRGDRNSKYARLGKEISARLALTQFHPTPPFYLLVPQDVSTRDEYDRFIGVASEAQESSLGILTKRDSLSIAFSPEELLGALGRFADRTRTDTDVAEEFGVPLSDKDKWDISVARASLTHLNEGNVRPLLYRPFDVRYVYYDDLMVARTNRRVLRHLEQIPGNKAFILGRQGMATGSETWDVCFVCDFLADQNIYRRGGGTVLPLHLAKDENGFSFDDSRLNLRLNFSQNLTKHFGIFGAKPEDIFHYIYAVFHSPGYRHRYFEFLKIDFPRLPLTGDLDLFRALMLLGAELVVLHLLESPKLSQAQFVGGNQQISKVGWTPDSAGTAWIDGKGTAKNFQPGTSGFRSVSKDVWKFHIGGYQVCKKWLKDRGPKKGKPGRVLTDEDIDHYQKIIVALSETIRIMKEIDEVIDEHGGWPRAFITEQ